MPTLLSTPTPSSKDINSIVKSTPTRLSSSPIEALISNSKLIKQGAEAKVYKTLLYPPPSTSSTNSFSSPSSSSLAPTYILLKHRFPKTYRHPTLDTSLTRTRLVSEARSLVRCTKNGLKVPGLRMVDLKLGVLGIEWIEGNSVREVLGGGQEDEGLVVDESEEGEDDVEEKWRSKGVQVDRLLKKIGNEIAKMHLANIVHGDLTTSNMMIREVDPTRSATGDSYELILIDFGLSSVSSLPEDRAVDLYVLERAFSSTHPVPLLESGEEGEPHFETVLKGYRDGIEREGKKGEWERIEKRLEEVRGRGRKRSMVG